MESVSWSSSWSLRQWEPTPNRGLGPSGPPVEQPSRIRKKCCYRQRNLGSICWSLFSLQLTSHTQPFCIKCERYIFLKNCVHSFIHYCWLCFCIYMYTYSCIMAIQQIETLGLWKWCVILTSKIYIAYPIKIIQYKTNHTCTIYFIGIISHLRDTQCICTYSNVYLKSVSRHLPLKICISDIQISICNNLFSHWMIWHLLMKYGVNLGKDFSQRVHSVCYSQQLLLLILFQLKPWLIIVLEWWH